MAKEKDDLTREQNLAITTRDKTLLVSAAAGSGKTYTLTKRIIESLLDKDNPLDIDSILVVTFTKTAAGELRTKISKALTKAVEENPDNENLKKQLRLLPSAKIRTIDGFCNDILRSNTDRVGISPGYRIADGAEIEILAISIIEGLIEAAYNGQLTEVATPEEFEELADCLTESGKTEELSSVFRYISLKCENAEEGIDILGKLIEKYEHNGAAVEDTVYGAYLMDRTREMLSHYINCLDKFELELAAGDEIQRRYLGVVDSDRKCLKRLRAITDYDTLREEINNVSWETLPRGIKADQKTEKMTEYQTFRDKKIKEAIKKSKKNFLYTGDDWRALYDNLHRLLTVFYRFEKKFDTLFREEKKRRGALSYNDIERYTYECLIQNGELTDIAKNVASQYDAIYIDEYQDVNNLQNRIFEAISKPNNRFMVGDIKQSIYVFRSARPDIFASMKNTYPILTEDCGDFASIFMSDNFRCDKGVIDFVNDIFDRAFSFVSESIGYVDSDRLKYSKKQKYGEPKYKYPVVCSVNCETEGETCEVVAEKIEQLTKEGRLNNGKRVRYCDIAIILRDAKGYDSKYALALEKRGIPSCISGAKDFFLSPEVLLALCLLNSIDNPRRDIYLTGLLCSPLFDFTPEDIMLIKQKNGDCIYESLVSYVEENPDFKKGSDFLKTLDYYRTISEGIGVDTLIHKLYKETGLLSLASKSGGKDNLILLFDYARSYEAGSFKGLYNFISFINNIINKKTTFDDARAKTETNAVKIITAHRSKGLEYPIVFFVESNKMIKDKDKDPRLAFCEDFGFAFKLRTPSGLAFVNNPVRDIIKGKIFRRIFEEELRVLYVLLTRARERLYVVGKCPEDSIEKYKAKIDYKRKFLSEYSFRKLYTYQDIILACNDIIPVSSEQLSEEITKENEDLDLLLDEEEKEDSPEESDNNEADGENASSNNIDYDEIMRRFNYKYPSAHLTTLPEKMSVSLMSPTVLDGSEDGEVWNGKASNNGEEKTITASAPFDDGNAAEAEENTDIVKKKRLPAFVLGTSLDESAKRGIATHLFMQFFNPENLAKDGAEAELNRLCDNGFISKEDKERVRLREIKMFERSDLLREMREAKKLHRELRFNVYLPATEFATDEKRLEELKDSSVLVQGVIDCIIENKDGEIILCDYKTDRLSKEELSDRTLAERALRDKHSSQLKIYALAIEKIFSRKPKRIEIYSLPLGDTISII